MEFVLSYILTPRVQAACICTSNKNINQKGRNFDWGFLHFYIPFTNKCCNFIHRLLHMDTLVLANEQKLTSISFVLTLDAI